MNIRMTTLTCFRIVFGAGKFRHKHSTSVYRTPFKSSVFCHNAIYYKILQRQNESRIGFAFNCLIFQVKNIYGIMINPVNKRKNLLPRIQCSIFNGISTAPGYMTGNSLPFIRVPIRVRCLYSNFGWRNR